MGIIIWDILQQSLLSNGPRNRWHVICSQEAKEVRLATKTSRQAAKTGGHGTEASPVI